MFAIAAFFTGNNIRPESKRRNTGDNNNNDVIKKIIKNPKTFCYYLSCQGRAC